MIKCKKKIDFLKVNTPPSFQYKYAFLVQCVGILKTWQILQFILGPMAALKNWCFVSNLFFSSSNLWECVSWALLTHYIMFNCNTWKQFPPDQTRFGKLMCFFSLSLAKTLIVQSRCSTSQPTNIHWWRHIIEQGLNLCSLSPSVPLGLSLGLLLGGLDTHLFL